MLCKFATFVQMCTARAYVANRGTAGGKTLNSLILLCILVLAIPSENSGMVPAFWFLAEYELHTGTVQLVTKHIAEIKRKRIHP